MIGISELMFDLGNTERLLIESISADTNSPLTEVVGMYRQECAALQTEAKIRTFIPVIAFRRVRIKLKSKQQAH